MPNNTNWIFITGENGSGKTTLLRSMGIALGYKMLSDKELEENPKFNVSLELFPNTESGSYRRRGNEDCSTKRFPMVSGLALYGPNRLDSTQQYKGYNRFLESIGKKGLFKSLFEKNAPLLDIESQFIHWTKTRLDKKLFEKRVYYIKNALINIVPGLYDIRFEEREKNKRITKYILRKNEYENEKGVVWDNLPSGTKSVLGLVSDILIRLSHYQKKNVDLSDLRGVVIIDEVDLHLHPKAQKLLIKNLAECFPHVQFIVTTHSPIPLLGAPENSTFFKMYKDDDEIIRILRLEKLEKEIKYLTPNTLLTSDFFDLEDIEHTDQNDINQVYLENDYRQIQFNQELKERLNKLDSKLLPDNLFD